MDDFQQKDDMHSSDCYIDFSQYFDNANIEINEQPSQISNMFDAQVTLRSNNNIHQQLQQITPNIGINSGTTTPHIDTGGEQLFQIFDLQTMHPIPNPQSSRPQPRVQPQFQQRIQPTTSYSYDRSQNRHLTQNQNIHFDQMERDNDVDGEGKNDNIKRTQNTNASTSNSKSSRSVSSTIKSQSSNSGRSGCSEKQDNNKNLSTLNEKRDAALLKLLSVFDSHQSEYVTCLENEMISLKEKLNHLSYLYINLRYENDRLRQLQQFHSSFLSNPPN